MWIYMMSCYLMSLLTFILIVIAFFQSFLKFQVFQAGHVTFMILICIVYLFTETLVIFFFVGSGMGIKESTIDKKLDPQFHRRSIAIKRKVYPPLLLNMLFMMTLFVLAGAVDTHHFPSWVYIFIFLGCIFHLMKAKFIQNQCFRDTTEIFREMAGLKQE